MYAVFSECTDRKKAKRKDKNHKIKKRQKMPLSPPVASTILFPYGVDRKPRENYLALTEKKKIWHKNINATKPV